ncbi:MAG: cupredoxin domain-containing protein [Sphingomicrobium sp.]
MSPLRFAIATAATLALASPAAAQPAQFVVQVYSYGFAPQPIRLAAGRRVTLTFVNQSGSSHDFSAHGFFRNARILAGDASEGEVDLPPHSSRSVTLVPRAGSYHAHCSHFFHKQLGMHDMIIVN